MPLRGRGTRRRDAARGAPRDRERLLLHVDRRGAAPLRRARAAALRRAAAQPDRAPVRADGRDLARALTPDYLERLARVQGRLARDRGEETWWRSRQRPVRPPRRLLLRGVRARREPPHLLRRARRSRRRLSQGGVGARHPARRDRPLLPPRLLPAAARRERPPGRALPADRYEPAAARARADGSRGRARGRQRRARPGAARRLARAGRPRVPLPDRHPGRAEIRTGPSPTPSTAATGRTGCGRRSCSVSAASACCAGSGSSRRSST